MSEKIIKVEDDTIMWFGIYKGKKMANIPPQYLLDLQESKRAFGPLRRYLDENVDCFKAEIRQLKK